MDLTDFVPMDHKGFYVPEYLYKGPSVIKVKGFVYSALAKHYWNVTFFGVLQAREGIPEEYVIGHLEIEKESGQFSEANIRYSRFREPRHVLNFARILRDCVSLDGV